jgi:hypothetical protein
MWRIHRRHHGNYKSRNSTRGDAGGLERTGERQISLTDPDCDVSGMAAKRHACDPERARPLIAITEFVKC